MSWKYIFWIGLISFLVLVVCSNLTLRTGQQFSWLAPSFLEGKTYFLSTPPSLADTNLYGGRYYWPLSFPPTLFVLPGVWLFKFIGVSFLQGYINMPVTLVVVFCCYFLARKHGFSRTDSGFLSLGFVFGSVYHQVAYLPSSWLFAQALTVMFLMLAIVERYGKRRYGVVGMWMGMAFVTRATAGLCVVWFVYELWKEKRLGKVVGLFWPMMVGLVLSGYYNYLRFGSLFDNGYLWANHFHGIMPMDGLFNIAYIANNFRNYFLNFSFEPTKFPGLGFWTVSPMFLWMFGAGFGHRTRGMWFGLLVALMAVLTYYWSGWDQIGPRYLLDLLPLAYIILLSSFRTKKLPGIFKIVVFASCWINVWMFKMFFVR